MKDAAAEAIQSQNLTYWKVPDGLGYLRVPQIDPHWTETFSRLRYKLPQTAPKIDDNDNDDEDEDEIVLPATGAPTDPREEPLAQPRELTKEEKSLLTLRRLPNKSAQWVTTLLCPIELFSFLIGKNATNKKRFERDFDVQIFFREGRKGDILEELPPNVEACQQSRFRIRLPRKELGIIEIVEEVDRMKLIEAREMMEQLILDKLEKLPYTHFVSLPFMRSENEELCGRFEEFRKRVLSRSDIMKDKIEESVFMLGGQLHLTLCMLRLYYEHQVDTAKEVLEGLFTEERLREFFKGSETDDVQSGFHINLSGLYTMNDDTEMTHIVYTRESEGGLHGQKDDLSTYLRRRRSAKSYINGLCEVLYQRLISYGLLSWSELQTQKLLDSAGNLDVNLHVTLMNSKLRSPSSPLLKGATTHSATTLLSPPRRGLLALSDLSTADIKDNNLPRIPFNAANPLKELGNFSFGIGHITGLHLSQRGKPSQDTHYYHADYILPLCKERGL